MNFDDISPDLDKLKGDNHEFIIDSLEKSINSQELYLSELEQVEDKTEDIYNSIKEAKKIIRINKNLLEEITIINSKEFSLAPIKSFFSPSHKDIKAYQVYSARNLVDYNKAVAKLGKNKKYKFHHPDHIALALNKLQYNREKTDKVLGIICLFCSSVSIRTHAAYVRYILGYFAGIFTLYKRIETLEKYEREGFPPESDEDKLKQYKKDMYAEINNKQDIITKELDDLLEYFGI